MCIFSDLFMRLGPDFSHFDRKLLLEKIFIDA